MMKLVFLLNMLLLISIFKVEGAIDSTRVLFIGNSITFYNNMPDMFRNIANNKGKNISVTTYAPGGAGIVNHFVDPNVFALFRNNLWDIVVIQPGTSESAGVSYPVDTTVKRGKVLLDSLYHYNPCAKVYLYEIPYGVPSATTYSTYFSVQTTIKDSVLKMADSLRVQMIPVGECARAYYFMNQNLLLHNSYNDIHPSSNGSFLTASAFYAGIFQDTASGCTFFSAIQQDTAKKFFSIVDTVVLNHLAGWRINSYNLHSDFSYSIAGNIVSFNCQSSNYTNVLWNFGDNNTSTSNNTNHTYSNIGAYTIKLFSYNGNCVDSIIKQINIISTGINEISNYKSIDIFPNPVISKFNLYQDISSDLMYVIFNSTGIKIQTGIINNSNKQINADSFAPGLYYLQLFENGKLIGCQKFVKIAY